MASSSHYLRSLGRHGLWGGCAVLAAAGGLLWWANVTELSGAVIAQGAIVSELGSQRIAHPDGGRIAEIAVRNEDHVVAGQLLLRLDGEYDVAALALIDSQLDEAIARKSRLAAEAEGKLTISPPLEFATRGFEDSVAQLMETQRALLAARRSSIEGRASQLSQQIAQLGKQIEGYQSQRAASQTELAVIAEDWDRLQRLNGQGLVERTRLNDSRRQKAQLEGQIGALDSAIATAQATVSERNFSIAELEDDFRGKVLEDLQAVDLQIAELRMKRMSEAERLSRMEIRAPVAGVVHQSTVQTIGGVAAPGDTLMLVVPEGGEMVLDARISPTDITKIALGQQVDVHLVGLGRNPRAELKGTIRSIAPDLTHDPITGASYYTARIWISPEQLDRLPANTVTAGMPADVYVLTGAQSVMSYLLKPINDQLAQVMRDS